LGRGLVELGFELISTGGTYKALTKAGIAVTYISAVTEFPEILDGRVKTLHPRLHGGILARATAEHERQCQENGIQFIDLICVNLYPFEKTIAQDGVTLEKAIENIDIGGPAMVRSAAKNHDRVTVIVRPADYDLVLENLRAHGEVPLALRRRLAAEAFAHTARYDALIATYLEKELAALPDPAMPAKPTANAFPQTLRLFVHKAQMLRYGENPDQSAALYVEPEAEQGSLTQGRQLQGKELSYNNWVDMDAAWNLVSEYDKIACAIIKHTNPCGLALGASVFEAYTRALACDPVSAFGGVIALNRPVDGSTASAIKDRFYEVIIAPRFDPEAQSILADKKNLRLFELGTFGPEQASAPAGVGRSGLRGDRIRAVNGGLLFQEEDMGTSPRSAWQVVTQLQPTATDLDELEFAWLACKHVKSNAIVVTKDRRILGVGAGQMNRVGSAEIALTQGGARSKGAYLASDAYFPFPDSVEVAATYGIRAIIQPGGSVRDREAIDTADKLGLIMVFTSRRHFRH